MFKDYILLVVDALFYFTILVYFIARFEAFTFSVNPFFSKKKDIGFPISQS